MRVKAAVVHALKEDYQLEEVKLSEPQADEVVVKVVASGICQSDEGFRLGKAETFPLPVVLGHEGAGIVEKVGSAVKDFQAGDQVVMAYNHCGTCPSCRTGHPASCVEWGDLNLGGVGRSDRSNSIFKEDGTPVSNFFNQSAFATYTVTNENNLVKVDPEIDLRLVGPLGCGLMTGFGTVLNGLKPEISSSIAIFGTGAVGLGALMTAKIVGCSTIIAIDIHEDRLEKAKELGATHTINSKTEDVLERVHEITGGLGVNSSLDTTGVSVVMKTALDVLAVGGTVAPVAVTPATLEIGTAFDLTDVSRKIVGVKMGDAIPQLVIPQLIQFYKDGKFPFDQLVKYYKFDEINQAAQDSSSGKVIKPILIIDETYRSEQPLV